MVVLTERERWNPGLVEAQRVRLGRAALMRQLAGLSFAESVGMAAEIVEDPPDLLASMMVGRLLERVTRVGPGTADRLMAAARVSPVAELGGLPPTKRAALAAVL